jgi:YD repeat-containing protein
VGQLLSTTDPLDNTTTYTYDQLGRLASTTAPDDGATTFAYSDGPYNDQRSVTDPTGAVTRADYDYLGRVSDTYQVVRQAGATYHTQYGYGTHGWLTSTTTHHGVVTSTAYNVGNRSHRPTAPTRRSPISTTPRVGRSV